MRGGGDERVQFFHFSIFLYCSFVLYALNHESVPVQHAS